MPADVFAMINRFFLLLGATLLIGWLRQFLTSADDAVEPLISA